MKMSRYAVLTIIILSGLLGITFGKFVGWSAIQGGFNDAIIFQGVDGFRYSTLLGLVVGALGALFFLRSKKYSTETGLIMDELNQVVWPNRDETVRYVYIVILTLIIAAAVLGIFDLFWKYGIGFLTDVLF